MSQQHPQVTHNSDYVVPPAAGYLRNVQAAVENAARLQDELDAAGVGRPNGAEELLKSWQLVGWPMQGDEDGGVSIRCPRCYERDMDAPWTPVTAPDRYPNLADAIVVAFEHTCPERPADALH